MLIAVVAGAITNIVLNSFMIGLYQHNGAAVASVVSECIVAAIEIIFVIKYIGLKFNIKIIMTSIFGGAGLYLIVTFIRQVMSESIVALLFSSIAGMAVYLLVFLLLERKLVLEFIHNKRQG